MDEEKSRASRAWVKSLARSDAELARGEIVPASVVHDDIRRALADMEAKAPEGTRQRRAALSHR